MQTAKRVLISYKFRQAKEETAKQTAEPDSRIKNLGSLGNSKIGGLIFGENTIFTTQLNTVKLVFNSVAI